MTTEAIIKTIAGSMDLTYMLGTLFQINQGLDKVVRKKQYPLCLQIQTTDGSFSPEVTQYYQRIHETQRVRLMFADAIKFDYEPELILDKVAALKAYGLKMVKHLNASGFFDQIGAVNYSVMYDRFDANLLAVLFEFDLTESDGVCIEELDEGEFASAFNSSFKLDRRFNTGQ